MSCDVGELTERLENELCYDYNYELCSEHTYSDHSWRCLPQPGTKRLGEGILRMEDAGTSEEDDDMNIQDSNIDRPRPSSPELFNKDKKSYRAWTLNMLKIFRFFWTEQSGYIYTLYGLLLFIGLLYIIYWNWCWVRSLIGISRSLICSKTLMKLFFIPCGEFQCSLEGPVSQIHSPHLHTGAPGIFSGLLRSVQMLKRELGAESNRKLLHLVIPSKIATLVPEFTVEELPLGRTAVLVPEFAVKDLPLGRTLWWWLYSYCNLL